MGLVEVLGKRLRLSEYSLSADAVGFPSASSASAAVVHSFIRVFIHQLLVICVCIEINTSINKGLNHKHKRHRPTMSMKFACNTLGAFNDVFCACILIKLGKKKTYTHAFHTYGHTNLHLSSSLW